MKGQRKIRLLVGIYVVFSVSFTPIACAASNDSDNSTVSVDSRQTMLRRTVEHDGIEREYFIHIPDAVADDENAPVVVAIHGYTSTATGFQVHHGLNRHADEHGYIAVYPQGSHFADNDTRQGQYRVSSWNDLAANQPPSPVGPHCTDDAYRYPCPPECGKCKRCDWTSCYDDLGFIEKMLDAVQAEFATDTQRYYLLGVSNGGMMTLRLGCSLSDRFAAIAPIIGQLAPGYACGPDVDLPMMHLFGGEDDTVRFDGRPGSDGFIYTSAADTAMLWAESLGCQSGPATWRNDYAEKIGLACGAFSDCNVAGHEVVSCLDPDGRHAWPSQRVEGVPATCVTAEQYESMPDQTRCASAHGSYNHDGMDLVWSFFVRYRNGG